MKRSACVVYPYPHPDSNPTLANLAQALGARGWDVEFYCAGGDARATDVGLAVNGKPSLLSPVPRPGLGFGGRQLERMRRAVLPQLYRLARRHSLLLGVDPQGLALAHRLNSFAGLPLAYISFEIMFRDEIGPGEEGLKSAELAACRDVSLTLVQDEERAEALAAETGLPREAMALVPNSPLPEPIPESDLLRQRLGIGADRRIVLYSGTLAGWASLHLLGEMVAHWPERFVLVLHSRTANSPRMRTWLQGLVDTGRVVVSPDPVPSAQLGELYASADYLLAPYMPVPDDWTSGKNIRHIGLSSGKVAHAALCGLPLLTTDLPVFRREFAAYRCGETYSSVSQSGALLEKMDADYATYSSEARRFYDERLDPRGPMAEFCDGLEGLLR